MHEIKIGAHVSVSGGLEKGVEKAHKIGANCMQIFSGSPRVWRKRDLGEIETDKLFAKVRENKVSPIFTHALYLVNLASDKSDLIRKSVDSLKYELQFDALIKGSGVVVHVGSHNGRGWDQVKEQVAEQINTILKDTPPTSKFLIENSAGSGGKIGSPLEEVQWLLNQAEQAGGFVSSNRIGWCFDTCHGFASGYYLAEKGSENGEAKVALEEIEQMGLWDTLSCIHVNDSKTPFNSAKDRHENLGDGEVGESDFKTFLTDRRVQKIPLILEVPGIEGDGPDAENINRLKKMVGIV